MFTRGRIDHFSVDLPDVETFEAVRRNLVELGATNGNVRDFGFVRILSFEDPDQMNVEIALRTGGAPLTMAQSRVETYT